MMSLSEQIIERLKSASSSYAQGPIGLHDSRGATYLAINVSAPTSDSVAEDLANQIIEKLGINKSMHIEYFVEPRITERGLNTLCYARLSVYLIS